MAQSDRPQRLKPPPNYRSRAVQFRLFTIVIACMAVLYLVTEAANPARWVWLASGGRETAVPKTVEEKPLDTHLDRIPGEIAPSSLAGAVVIADPYRSSLDMVESGGDGLSRALTDGWAALYQSFTGDERGLIAKAFKRTAEQKPLDEADLQPWRELLGKGDRFWSGYRENAAKGLAQDNQLTSDEMTAWLHVLGRVGEEWIRDREVLDSLASTTPSEVTATRDDRLERLKQRWQRLSLAAIKDDTVHRPAESDAWFWLADILKNTSQADLERQGAAPVGFVQLFKQPKDYRGKLITTKGRIVQAKRVKSAKNPYGIEYQYLLWIQPQDGPQTPIVAYALELPEGFPSLDKPNAEGGYTRMREDVDLTGYFFKRWAYRARDGINTAPLLLVKVPHWHPSLDVGAKSDQLPSGWVFASWVLGAALFGIAISAMIYIRTRDSSIAIEALRSSPLGQQELQRSIESAQAGPSVQETLRELEQRHRQPRDERTS